NRYRRLALQYNPERQGDEKLSALFCLVGEAYEVLTTPLLKALYDQYGETGMKKGVLTPFGWYPPYAYHGDPLRTYKEFFGTCDPYADLMNALDNPPPMFDSPEGRGIKKKEPTLEKPLALTLNEVFFGALKKVKIERRVFTTEEQDSTEIKERILKIDIRPGLPAGTRLIFKEVGDMGPTIIPGDIEFVTEDKPHPVFKREGVDLIMKCHITLEEALNGTIVELNTIDDKTIRVAITDVVTPEFIKVVEGEGMPYVNNPAKRGDLILTFDVEYPKYIPQTSKKLIKKAFSNAAMLCPGPPEMVNKLILADKIRRTVDEDR
ncbi:hypothetical protein AAG570_011582, partial [Ranatra chinensis]